MQFLLAKHNPEGLPKQMVTFLRQLSHTAEKLLGQPGLWELTHSVSANIVGGYVTISEYQHKYGKDRWDTLTQYYCFGSDYRQISLHEIFVDGYDYSSLIMEKLEEVLGHDFKDSYSTQDLYEDLQFSLGASAVLFCTKAISIDTGSSHSLQFQVPYKDFGCHNMTIFPE